MTAGTETRASLSGWGKPTGERDTFHAGRIDAIAVERAMHGDPVPLTPEEQVATVIALHQARHNDLDIAQRIHRPPKIVQRIRQAHGLAPWPMYTSLAEQVR